MIRFVKSFFKCVACSESLGQSSWALCDLCRESLKLCPTVCSRCGGLNCQDHLKSDSSAPGPESYTAYFLSIGRAHRVLTSWKHRQGLRLSTEIFRPRPEARLRERLSILDLTHVVPVPQTRARSRKLGGSPAAKTADWVSLKLDLPVLHCLSLVERQNLPRQAELSAVERASKSIRFELAARLPLESRILLVDDFMTTGKTLRQAAEFLRRKGATGVHGFCLGLRPRWIKPP